MGVVAKQGVSSAVYLFIGFAIGALNNMVIIPYVFRGEAREYWGLIQVVMSWAIIFSQCLNLGASSIAVRYMPALKAEGRESQVLFYLWFFPLAGMLLLSLFLLVFGDWFVEIIAGGSTLIQPMPLLVGLFVTALVMTLFRAFNGLSVAYLRTPVTVFFNEVFIRVVLLTATAFYFFGYWSMDQVYWFHPLAYGLQFLLFFIVLRDLNLFRISFPLRTERRDITRFGIYSSLDNGANVLVNRMDVIMIGAIVALGDVQVYQMALYMATVIMLPGRALANVSTSVVAHSWHKGEMQKVQVLYQKNSLNQFLAGGIIFVLIWSIIDPVLTLLPAEYAMVKELFLYLGISKLFDAFTSINGSILSVSPYYRYNFYFNLLLVVLVYVTNLLMLPIWGTVGAAIATAICIFLLNLLKGWFLYARYGLHPVHRNTWRVLLCLLVPFAIDYLLPQVFSGALAEIVFRGAVLGSVFFVLLWVTRASEDIHDLLRGWLQRFRRG